MAISRLTQTTLQNGFEKYNQIWDGRSAVGSMEAISSITLSAAQSSIEFNNIPGTYSHLQLRFSARDNRGLSYSYLGFRFNGDTGSNYRNHFLAGNGTNGVSGTDGVLARFAMDGIPGSGTTANIYGGGILDILDYTSSNKNKTMRAFIGYDGNASGNGAVYLYSGLWFATPAAITSMTILDQSSGEGSFSQYSTFTLYGIK